MTASLGHQNEVIHSRLCVWCVWCVCGVCVCVRGYLQEAERAIQCLNGKLALSKKLVVRWAHAQVRVSVKLCSLILKIFHIQMLQ